MVAKTNAQKKVNEQISPNQQLHRYTQINGNRKLITIFAAGVITLHKTTFSFQHVKLPLIFIIIFLPTFPEPKNIYTNHTLASPSSPYAPLSLLKCTSSSFLHSLFSPVHSLLHVSLPLISNLSFTLSLILCLPHPFPSSPSLSSICLSIFSLPGVARL